MMVTEGSYILTWHLRLGWIGLTLGLEIPAVVSKRIVQVIDWGAGPDAGPFSRGWWRIAGRYPSRRGATLIFRWLRLGRYEIRIWTRTATARFPRGVERCQEGGV